MLSENEIQTKVNFLSSARCNHTFHKYIDITGDLIEGTLLSRILYWFAPSKDNKSKVKIYKDGECWIAKQRKDWWEEIRITERQYDKAIKSLVKKKFVITAKYKFNSMPTIHIRPNYDVINAEVKKWEENIRQEVIAEDRGQELHKQADGNDTKCNSQGNNTKCNSGMPQDVTLLTGITNNDYPKMRQEGALVVKSNNGSDNKADVDVMTSELNQTEGQVVFTDLFERFLSIQGLANRQGNTGGDTGSAVELRNGHYDAGLRTAINEPILKKSERMALRLILNRLRINKGFTLMPSDVEIHINHNKLDNMLVKAEVLEILLRCGINYKRAVKTIDMFSDPEQVTLESAKRMEMLFPEEQPTTATPNNNNYDKNNGKTAD